MRKVFLSVVLLLSVGLSARALEYNEARRRAWYLTDKMAYELNLSPEQYDLVYEINLDYFLQLNNRYDIAGNYWSYRHTDLQYVLLDWQYSLYCNTSYFYLPVAWQSSSWYYPVYSHYQGEQYYFDRPTVYVSYRGTTTPRGNNDMGRYYGNNVNYTRGMRDLYETQHNAIYHNNYATYRHTHVPHYRSSTEPQTYATPSYDRNYNRSTGEHMVNATRTQRSHLQGNTIPALRIERPSRTDTATPRLGRSSSTRVTVNLGHRENEPAGQPQFNRQHNSNATRGARDTH